MSIPHRVITERELRQNTGDRGARMWIARGGIVYDVTDCPKWRTGLHEGQHFAGQDLTDEFPEAPHKEEVFKHDCVKVVGRLSLPPRENGA
jgi:predicted heme/steroid binding protein